MSAADPVSPLASLLAPGLAAGHQGADTVTIVEHRYDLVQIFARAARAQDLAASIQTSFGLALPPPGHATHASTLSALWIQPDAWMLMAPRAAEGELARAARSACGNAASVVDQSHGRCTVALSGRRAAWVLAKLCRIDLHPRRFGPGRVAVTPVAGLSCILHQRDETPSYHLVVSATFARSFVAALLHAAQETGYRIG